jgi:hypothetical protein
MPSERAALMVLQRFKVIGFNPLEPESLKGIDLNKREATSVLDDALRVPFILGVIKLTGIFEQSRPVNTPHSGHLSIDNSRTTTNHLMQALSISQTRLGKPQRPIPHRLGSKHR